VLRFQNPQAELLPRLWMLELWAILLEYGSGRENGREFSCVPNGLPVQVLRANPKK